MPYARDFGNGQEIRVEGTTVVVSSGLGTDRPFSLAFDARRFVSATFGTAGRLTVYLDGLHDGYPEIFPGNRPWSFGTAELLEAVREALGLE